MRRIMSALSISIVVATVLSLSLSPARALEAAFLTPPVDAAVLDPFRLPNGPYGAGNRGIEYDTFSGDAVRAAAAGVVIFAGPVARSLHVTVDHGSGLLTSYSFLDQILVRRGDHVERGERVGTAGPSVHFGVRVNGAYVDPAGLFGRRVVVVRLVAHSDGRSRAALDRVRARQEAGALRDLVETERGAARSADSGLLWRWSGLF